jgi:rod shape-determining protein MreB
MHGLMSRSEASPRSKILRVGLDIGFQTTVFQSANRLSELFLPKTHRIPTWLAYTDKGPGPREGILIGEQALFCRHELPLVHPIESGNPDALRDFADALRAAIDPDDNKELWGVVNCPPAALSEDLKNLRLVANQIFDRTCFLDSALLMATSFGCQEVARNSIWIDLGATSVRVALIQGGSPEPGKIMVVPGGGNLVDARIRETMGKRFPDLLLTQVTINQLKERFAHVSPVDFPCMLRVLFEGTEQTIDVAPILRRACDPIVKDVLEGLRRLLQLCPSDSVEELFGNIVVAGGGARIAGVGERLREEVRSEFGEEAIVRIPEDPTVLVANGALRWAHFLEDDEWGIPLFSFAPGAQEK